MITRICTLLTLLFVLLIYGNNVEANNAHIIEKLRQDSSFIHSQQRPVLSAGEIHHPRRGCTMFFAHDGTTFLLSRETEESASKRAQSASAATGGPPAHPLVPDKKYTDTIRDYGKAALLLQDRGGFID
ncbi:hypothetical protein ACFL60_02905 [Candidatus Omnitrophota bacterium]